MQRQINSKRVNAVLKVERVVYSAFNKLSIALHKYKGKQIMAYIQRCRDRCAQHTLRIAIAEQDLRRAELDSRVAAAELTQAQRFASRELWSDGVSD